MAPAQAMNHSRASWASPSAGRPGAHPLPAIGLSAPRRARLGAPPGLHTSPTTAATAAADVSPSRPPIGNPAALPEGTKEVVDQAFASCQRAWEAGVKRQRVELELPLIGATDIDDWPGGIRQQFKAASPMVENLLRQLRQLPGLDGALRAQVLDSADAVGSWEGENLGLVLFPTAETLREVRRVADARPAGLSIIANPQWSTEGNVVSDFGIFPWQRRAAEEVVGSFTTTYSLQQVRINGDYCRWLYTYPQGWQVNVVTGPGQSSCILQSEQRPSYAEVEATLRTLPWAMSSKGLVQRIQAEAEFNRKSLQRPPPNRGQ